MDCNLKKLAHFCQVCPMYFGEIAMKLNIVFSFQEKSLNIFFSVL